MNRFDARELVFDKRNRDLKRSRVRVRLIGLPCSSKSTGRTVGVLGQIHPGGELCTPGYYPAGTAGARKAEVFGVHDQLTTYDALCACHEVPGFSARGRPVAPLDDNAIAHPTLVHCEGTDQEPCIVFVSGQLERVSVAPHQDETELCWWITYLLYWNGLSFLPEVTQEEIFTDSFLTGYSIVWGNNALTVQGPLSLQKLSISFLEQLAIQQVINIPALQGKVSSIYCDNTMAIIAYIKQFGMTRSSALMDLALIPHHATKSARWNGRCPAGLSSASTVCGVIFRWAALLPASTATSSVHLLDMDTQAIETDALVLNWRLPLPPLKSASARTAEVGNQTSLSALPVGHRCPKRRQVAPRHEKAVESSRLANPRLSKRRRVESISPDVQILLSWTPHSPASRGIVSRFLTWCDSQAISFEPLSVAISVNYLGHGHTSLG
ncbi:hypothetical protein [Parasitella parasitica]|uniref:Uncharacterized protein n=1 Tax=Parasitella parasitica TaxID=35722 RepID=A0A0B7NEE7_9FUNG|nr:hypothetical protein [Parasitella parasitica]